jgi:response regulator of citrate/malate metabolism
MFGHHWVGNLEGKNGVSQTLPRGISKGITSETLRALAKCMQWQQTGWNRDATNSSCSSLKGQARRSVISAHNARHRSSISAVLAC